MGYTERQPIRSMDNIFFINGNNLHDGKIVITNDTKVVEHAEFIKHQKPLNDRSILMSINGTIGNLGLFGGEPIMLGKSAAYLNVKPEISKQFVYHSLQTHPVKQQFFDGLTGSTIGNLGLATIRQTQIPLPSTEEEQQAIATALSDMDALLAGLGRLIAKKRDLKQATMQALLNGRLRLPGFNGRWEVKRLGEIAEIVMGQSPSSANYNTKGDGLPLIQGNADISNRQTIRRIFTTQITKRGKIGDILMSVRAPVGEVAHAMFDVCLGRGVCAIRFPNDFLYHWLVFHEPNWAKHSKGSTFDSVNSSDVKAVEIRLPTDSTEQIAIAAVLADMDAEIAALEQRRRKTQDLKQAMMQDLLTGRTRLI